MTATKISYLPNWKKNATPEERLMEVVSIARNHPEWFSKMVVIYAEDTGAADRTRYASNGCTTMELLGLLKMTEVEIFDTTQRS